MISFLRQKKSFRFVLTSALLTGAAIGAAAISAIAVQMGESSLASLSSKFALGLALLIVVYVVPRLAQSLHWQSEYALQVPNAGLVFSALILIVTVLALVSGNNLLYLVLAVLLATMVVSLLISRVMLKRLAVQLRRPAHLFAGETAPFEITVSSEKRSLPSFSLTVEVSEEPLLSVAGQAPARKLTELTYLPVLPAKTQARARCDRTFSRRGVYQVYGFVISTAFPFGFLEQRRFIEAPEELIVYPQPQALADVVSLLPLSQGQLESRVKGAGSDLYAIRPYLSSDHHHHIDWKATAKTGRLMVREFTRDDDWRVTICFDAQRDSAQTDEAEFASQFERAIGLAAGLVTHFLSAGAEVRLLTDREDSRFGIGQAHRYELLRQLAQLTPNDANDDWSVRFPELMGQMPGAEEPFRVLLTPVSRTELPLLVTRAAHVVSFGELAAQSSPAERDAK